MTPETKKALATAGINALLVVTFVIAGNWVYDKYVPKPTQAAAKA